MDDSGAESAEALDPRVQIELERLNTATDEINRLEVELDEARLAFRRLLAEGHLRIQQLTRKLGTSIHKARPYYEARFRANITAQELHTANLAYDKANSAHSAAREMVFLAEQGLSRLAEGSAGVTLDPAWQEMLNHATSRVNQAESDRASSALSQRARAASHRAAAHSVAQLQSSLKRHITKSRPYFEEKARINAALETQKAKIQTLERQVGDAKQKYSRALRNLERISDEIHKHRSRRQSMRNEQKLPSPQLTNGTEPLSDEKLSELCDVSVEENVRDWLRGVDQQVSRDDTWTEIDLEYSSPEEVSFDKCPIRSPSLSVPVSRVSSSSPRRVLRNDARVLDARVLDARPRRASIDALLHETGEKVKEMFQGLRPSPPFPLLERRASGSSSPRGALSDDRASDTDSLHSLEMLTDEQIASLMLDAQLEAVCDKLAGVAVKTDIQDNLTHDTPPLRSPQNSKPV